MILADKILMLRKKNGWSQEELAERAGVSRQAVSKWEGAQAIPDVDKILLLAELFSVTTDYLLKDDIENEEHTEGAPISSVRKITLSEANEYLQIRKRAALRIAIATLICIISIFPLLILGAASETPSFIWSEDIAAAIGLVAMVVIATAAICIFLRVGFESAPYEFIEKEPFVTEYGVVGFVRDMQKKYRSTYARLNISGTCFCVLSPILLFSFSACENDLTVVLALTAMMLIAGIGAAFFILAGVRWASMEKLLKEGEYRPSEMRKSRIKGRIALIFWLFATAVFFIVSFLCEGKADGGSKWGGFRYSVVVWPVAALIFVAIMVLCDILLEKNKEEK